MVKRAAPLLIALVAALCLWLGGAQALGKLALMLGRHDIAARLLADPGARGAALYHAGDYAGADAAFQEAGRGATYNRGLSLAALGRYELSRAYFDAVLFADHTDNQARENRAIVDALVDDAVGESDGAGRIAALVAASRPGSGGDDVASQLARRRENVRRPLDARALAADEIWLETLGDAPGEYLRARLRVEYERRRALGLTIDSADAPW